MIRNKAVLLTALFLIGTALAVASFATWFDLSALPKPGPFETYVATKAKHWFVYRESHAAGLQERPAAPGSLANAQMIFGSECTDCHGDDGRTPTDIGRGLYPRAPNLGTAEVQGWSDHEVFWIIRNGIRLSGMPAFGKQLTNAEIWDLVRYVKSLQAPKQNVRK